jgi:protocatechuate 3,4-dioxygenase beta subunit
MRRITRAAVLAGLAAAIMAGLLLLLRPLAPASAPAPAERTTTTRPPPALASAPSRPRPAPSSQATDEVANATAPTRAPVPEVEDAAPKLRIHGRVIDSVGAGIARADVEVRAWSGKEPKARWNSVKTKAALDGAFEVVFGRDLATNGFGLETTAQGYVEGWKAVKLDEYDEARGIDVVVEAARAITGRVIDRNTRGIPGAVVQLWYGSETTWPTPVDADGRFLTPTHAPKRSFDLIVEAPGYTRRVIPVAASSEETTDLGDIAFSKGGVVEGIVVDAQGQPVPDIWLEVRQVEENGKRPRACTDSGGRFRFEDVDSDRVTIRTAGGGGRQYHGQLTDVRTGQDLRLVASAWTTVWLNFIDVATRKPVDLEQAEYGLRPEGSPEPERLGHGASSANLVSTVLSVESGHRYDVTVRAAGFDEGHVNGIDVGDVAEMTVEVMMRRKR